MFVSTYSWRFLNQLKLCGIVLLLFMLKAYLHCDGCRIAGELCLFVAKWELFSNQI